MTAPAVADPPVCTRCAVHAESVFRIDGMCCGEEAKILQRRLTPLSGIEDVAPDIVGQRLHVKYDAAVVSTNAIVEAVAEKCLQSGHSRETGTPGSDHFRRCWAVESEFAIGKLDSLNFKSLSFE